MQQTDFEKAEQLYGLNDGGLANSDINTAITSATQGIVTQLPVPQVVKTPTEVSLVPTSPVVPVSSALFIDGKTLGKHIRDNKIKIGVNWTHFGLGMLAGVVVGAIIVKATSGKKSKN